uniref:Coiled-coil domain containing 171 n=1 Tax=Amphilophus citrinellus TaxID=61819 RepID=A0A3Q0RKR6_AMPCI
VLIQEQCNQLHTLQRRVDTHTAEQAETQRTLSQTTQVLSEARQEVSRKERSLRILGKHLSGVQKEKKQVEQRLQRAEDELRDATRWLNKHTGGDTMLRVLQFRDSLIQSQHSLTAKPRPLLLPLENLELSGTESIMGAPEVAACQSFLSIVSQLCHTCSSRIDWLEQEVSAHRSHVTALRSELQDACLRDNLAFVPSSLPAVLVPPVTTHTFHLNTHLNTHFPSSDCIAAKLDSLQRETLALSGVMTQIKRGWDKGLRRVGEEQRWEERTHTQTLNMSC